MTGPGAGTEEADGRLGVRHVVASALAFSVMALLVKVAGRRLPTQEIVLVRAVISLVLSWLLLRRAGLATLGRRRGLLCLRGVLGFAGMSCFYYAITHLPLAEATVLQYLHPVFTAVLAALFLGERAGARVVAAILVCLVGVVLVTQPDFVFGTLLGAEREGLPALPSLVALAGAFFAASAYVTVRALSRTEHSLVIVFWFPLVSVPLSIPALGAHALWPTPLEWLVLAGVGLATQVGQVTLTRGLQLLTAGRVSALSYLQIVFAAAWGALLFGERPGPLALAGAALVLGGTWLVARDRPPPRAAV